ncbi:hypothetical protein ANN_04034 [Periplaneta americana]|uniref:Laminin IV type A domain-containing protein n=1 Tax=Periplaneta americana TaxID=6978 RepID=A0ABQ8T866_PERAM|nr:hypothetical protein ANN_04034 [Periplaneta americana]
MVGLSEDGNELLGCLKVIYKLHESLWQQKSPVLNESRGKVTREMLMVALQNVQHILIRASDTVDFTKAVLRDVSLDTGILAPGRPPPLARGVELCDCPPQYNSTSCQDPSIGFYRWYDNNSISSTIIIQLIGEARPCQCNQRSRICDIETGYCLAFMAGVDRMGIFLARGPWSVGFTTKRFVHYSGGHLQWCGTRVRRDLLCVSGTGIETGSTSIFKVWDGCGLSLSSQSTPVASVF